jgi:hypothetical protein
MDDLLKFESLVRAAMSDHPALPAVADLSGGGGGSGIAAQARPPNDSAGLPSSSGRGAGGYEASSQVRR